MGNGLSFLGFIVSRPYLCSDNYGQEEDMALTSIFQQHPVRLDMEIVESREVLGDLMLSLVHVQARITKASQKNISRVCSFADAAGKSAVGIFR